MEFGIGMFGDNHYVDGQPQPTGQRLRELVAEIKLMDQVGIDYFGLGEHHRQDYAVSTPEIVLAAAATVTSRIRLGSAVTVLSSTDPVRVYQQYATIDHLSNGRAEITAGRGSFIESFPLYGYELDDYESLFEEKLELLTQLNQQERITWKGKHRAALRNQHVLPRAEQPQLPVWVAVGGTPESVIRAARLGLPVVFAIIGGNPAQFKPLFDFYRRSWEEFGHDPEQLQVGVHMHCFFGDDAEATADAYYPHYAAQMDRVGKDRGWPAYRRSQYDAGRSNHGHLIVGNAEQAIEKISRLQKLFGLTRFIAHMDVGGPPHEALMRSIEIFGKEVVSGLRQV